MVNSTEISGGVKEVYSPEEVREALGVGQLKTIKKWIENGKIKAVKFKRGKRVDYGITQKELDRLRGLRLEFTPGKGYSLTDPR